MRPILIALALAVGATPPMESMAQSTAPPPVDTAAYYFLLGRQLESTGRVDEAIAAHNQAIALDPQSAELYAELAGLYARQDKAPESLEAAEAALARDPANHEANRILGTVYAALAEQAVAVHAGDDPKTYPARAIAALEKARDDGFDVGLELSLGRLYAQTRAYDKAIASLRRVVEDQPQYLEAAFLLAGAQQGAGLKDEAAATLRGIVAVNDGSYRAHLGLAELYEEQEQWAEAADAFAKAQQVNPRATMLTSRRAVALISAGKPADARALLEVSAAKSDDPILLYLLAESQRLVKDVVAAEATARKLLAKSAGDPRGLHVLSLVLQDKGDVKGAEQSLRDLIARDPLDANALNSLGYMFAERGEKLDEAVALVERALRVDPGNPSYLDSLGWAYYQQGKVDLADKPLTDAADKLPANSVIQDHLGDLRFKQRRFSDAVQAWERALGGDGQSIDRAVIEKKLKNARGRM